MNSALAWGLLALTAVLWPSRLVGPLDGVPLDTLPEALLIGLVFPVAWMLSPDVWRLRAPRALAATLAAWKLGTWLLLTQQGLCAVFAMHAGPPDLLVLRRSWDFRTPGDVGLPQCSSVVTRSLASRDAFPAWFLNQPVGIDRDLDTGLGRSVEPPPVPSVLLHVTGHVASPDGVRTVDRQVALAGESWRFDRPWGPGETATIDPPTRADLALRHAWFVSPLLTAALIGLVAWRAVGALALPRRTLAALAVMAAAAAGAGLMGESWARVAPLGLIATLVLAVPAPLRGPRGVLALVGIPVLALLAGWTADEVGRFTLYTPGDDWQTFQRHAGRIYFEGFWLEGGERTFWQQPLYRWIAGLFHVVFGDSSVGETYWDGYGLTAAAALAYGLVRLHLPHRWALGGAVATVATTLLGPNWYLVGRGLSEISATLWLALAALALVRARAGGTRQAAAAGLFATLAFYTRLNHLILVPALLVLLLPDVPAGRWTPGTLLRGFRVKVAAVYGGVLAAGAALFAARTWYFTGHFSLLHGTTRHFNSTGLGLDTLGDPVVWRRVLDSVLMVVTVSDPPRFDPRSVMVVAGVVAAAAGLARIPVARDVPLAPAVLTLAAISGAFIARGMAYPGRFSVHLIPLAVAVSVLVGARALRHVQGASA